MITQAFPPNQVAGVFSARQIEESARYMCMDARCECINSVRDDEFLEILQKDIVDILLHAAATG